MSPTRRPVTDVVATGVGLVGAGFGSLLLVAPCSGGPVAAPGRHEHPSPSCLGLLDLTLGSRIVVAGATRRRWLPVAAHALTHLPFAREHARGGRPLGVAVMLALLAFDAAVAAAARRR